MKLGFALAIPKRTSLTLAALIMLVLMAALLTETPGASAQTNSPATGQPTIGSSDHDIRLYRTPPGDAYALGQNRSN